MPSSPDILEFGKILEVCLSGNVVYIYWNESDGSRIIIRTSDGQSRAVEVELTDPDKKRQVASSAFETLKRASYSAAVRSVSPTPSGLEILSKSLYTFHSVNTKEPGKAKHLFFDLRKITSYTISREYHGVDLVDIRITVEHSAGENIGAGVFIQLGTSIGADMDKKMKEVCAALEHCWEKRGQVTPSPAAAAKPPCCSP